MNDILLVDDEPLARMRLRTLLADCPEAAGCAIAEAGHAQEARDWLHALAARGAPAPLVLLDIHMPGEDGLRLAQALRAYQPTPIVVFVTAYAEHAVQAFEVEAADYLTKPVRLERLRQALAKARRAWELAALESQDAPTLLIQYRGRAERVPVSEVLYCKAELKYVTVRTAARSYIWDGALSELETRHAHRFLRIHRSTLVARQAIRKLEKHVDAEEGEGWAVRLQGLDELLPVSRRQVSAVREAMG